MSEVDELGLYIEGDPNAPILVVVDPPSQRNWENGVTISEGAYRMVKAKFTEIGVDMDDVCFAVPSAPVPARAEGSDARQRDHLKEWAPDFQQILDGCNPRVIVPMGKLAVRQVFQRAAKITQVRGQVTTQEGTKAPCLPMLSPGMVLRLPANDEIFNTDFYMLKAFIESGYDPNADILLASDIDYQYRFDISDILEKVETGEIKTISLDVEATGLDWFRPEVVPLTAQFAYDDGKAIVVPLHTGYWNRHRAAYEEYTGVKQPVYNERMQRHVKGQLAQLLGDARVRKVGHNFKIDNHFMRQAGIPVSHWDFDTMIGAFVIDENMTEKSLDECVRRWVPAMAGYADTFNQETDKSRMIDVPLDKMLAYGGGDADASRRLAKVQVPLCREDRGQWQCLQKIQLPAIRAFGDVIEVNGLPVNTDRLSDLQEQLDIRAAAEYRELIQMVPKAVIARNTKINKKTGEDKGLKFSRPDFVRDILFSEDGFGLVPKVFTKSTQKLDDHEKIPSSSAKDHLPYFGEIPFVAKYMDYTRLEKLRSTYVGSPGVYYEETDSWSEERGFWKYIHEGYIHPSFLLHRTVTGRTASANPNAQNFPKRGKAGMKEAVKAFRRVFQAPPGWKIIEADLSQAELRVAAWMANETTMIDLYCRGEDVHAATAARTMGISMEQFGQLDKDTRDMKRFQAKAINFGFLYGMWWRKFMAYAKTDYGIDVTEREAQQLRETFFQLFPRLQDWHEDTKAFAREHGYVRALHGAVRHLPNIFSPDDGIKQESERQAVNSPVQRFASDLGLSAMARFARDCPRDVMKPVAFIHDAVVVIAREDYAEEAGANLKFYMESPPLWEWFKLDPPLPIVSDVSIGDNMADVVEMKEMEAVKPEWYQHVEDGRLPDYELIQQFR